MERKKIGALVLYVKNLWSGHMKLQEAADLYLDRQTGMISEATQKIYGHGFKHAVRYFGAEISVRKIDKLKAEAFRTHLINYRRYSKSSETHRIDGNKLATSTVRQVLKIARILFEWLHEIGKVDSNPFKKLKPPPLPSVEPKIVEKNDFSKFVASAKMGNTERHYNEVMTIRDTAILYFFASTGCRVSGASTTRLCDLQFFDDSAETIVREKFQGGPKARTVFLTETSAMHLLLWLDVRPETPGHDFLFVNLSGPHRGTQMSAYAFRKMIYTLYDRYQALCKTNPDLDPISEKISPHRLRATAISQWLENNMSDAKVAKLAGNSEMVMRKHYARINKKQLKEAHNKSRWIEDLS